MIRGLRGQFLPESFKDFEELKATGYAGYRHCAVCREDFFTSNTFTRAGWLESQISGTCEKCFDKMFADADESEGDCV